MIYQYERQIPLVADRREFHCSDLQIT